MNSNDIKDFATPAFGFAEKDEAWNSLKQYAKAIVSMNKCFQKKVALKIELFAFRYYIIYVTWISYIMTENERKLADLIVNYDRHIADAQEYIKENFGVSSEYDAEEGSLRLYVTNVNYALQILAAKEYLEDRLPVVLVKF